MIRAVALWGPAIGLSNAVWLSAFTGASIFRSLGEIVGALLGVIAVLAIVFGVAAIVDSRDPSGEAVTIGLEQGCGPILLIIGVVLAGIGYAFIRGG